MDAFKLIVLDGPVIFVGFYILPNVEVDKAYKSVYHAQRKSYSVESNSLHPHVLFGGRIFIIDTGVDFTLRITLLLVAFLFSRA